MEENDEEEPMAMLTTLCTTQYQFMLAALATFLGGRRSNSSNMIEMIRTETGKQKAELEKIVSWPKSEDERVKARRKKVIEELEGMPELELNDKVKLATILLVDVQKTNDYLALPPLWKYKYCMRLLGSCK